MNPLKMQNRKSSESKDKDKKPTDFKLSEKKHDSKEEKKDLKKEPSKDEKGEKRDVRYHSAERKNGKDEGRKVEMGSEKDARKRLVYSCIKMFCSHPIIAPQRSRSPDRSRARSRKSDSRGVQDRSLSAKNKYERRERDVLTFDKIKVSSE